MKKIQIEYKPYTNARGEQRHMLSLHCPNGQGAENGSNPCMVGSAYCLKKCKYCDRKNSLDYKYVMCKLDNRQIELF